MKIIINDNGTIHSFYDDATQVEAVEGQTLFHVSGYHPLEIGHEIPATLTTTEAKLNSLRIERNTRLECAAKVLDRHRNQKLIQGKATTITDEQAVLVAVYMQALRDMPETVEDLDAPVWPAHPIEGCDVSYQLPGAN